ncbi:NAD-dependent epimerase/dehydratase family protein [Nocardioides litoris]|uniref:NAD-dependent epimerase/dehydratase family protein n=1 Tax=Nocardioides litoris TaxID=1926648 RepID=UPI0011238FB7|nr:NAD-dependent epimerase/dehydratase family protein [Nocardioides litoris]
MTRGVLVTGGAGFIGSALVRHLVERGDHVTVLDNLSPQVHGPGSGREDETACLRELVHLVEGDVRHRPDWDRAYDGQDVVVHLAAETGTGQSMYEVARYSEVNVTGTAHLLDLLANSEHQVSRVVVASSRAIYGEGRYVDADGAVHHPTGRSRAALEQGRFEPEGPDGRPLTATATDEDARTSPTSVYGVTKATQEQLVLVGCAALGIDATALRYQNVYGPGQSLTNPYTGILSIFTSLVRRGEHINVFEDGLESRDFVYIDDVVEATARAVHTDLPGQRVYNVGTGVPVSVLEVVESLGTLLGRAPAYDVTGTFRAGDIRHNWADTARLQADLGLVPGTGLRQGMEHLLAWATQFEPAPPTRYRDSLAELRDRKLMA